MVIHPLGKTQPPKGRVVIDGDRLLLDETSYLDRRGAIVWPTPNSQGCLAIFGLAEKSTMHATWPLELLYEIEKTTIPAMIAAMSAKALRFGCLNWFADLKGNGNDTIYRPYLAKIGGGVSVYDTSEFPPLEEIAIRIDEMGRKGLVKIPKGTRLDNDKGTFRGMFGKKADAAMVPALSCLAQVVFSYDLWPYDKKLYGDPMRKKGAGYR